MLLERLISAPIDIKRPIASTKIRSYELSSSPTPSASPSPSSAAAGKLVLKGGPYHNTNTVKEVLRSCVPELTNKQATVIVNEAQKNSHAAMHLRDKTSANKGCMCLIENGIFASVEEEDLVINPRR
jgi:hypothetical protein